MLPRLAALALLLLVPACGSDDPEIVPVTAPPVVVSPGAVVPDDTDAALRELLLQPDDLPGQPERRESGSTGVSTALAPQLALCRPLPEVAPHRVASVIAKSGKPGEVEVFQVVSAFADEAAAKEAYDAVRDAAQDCPGFDQQGGRTTVEDLADLDVAGADEALHYRLTTPDVFRGDVRTLGRSGRHLVLITGFGAPPGGQPILAFQQELLAKSLARLP